MCMSHSIEYVHLCYSGAGALPIRESNRSDLVYAALATLGSGGHITAKYRD